MHVNFRSDDVERYLWTSNRPHYQQSPTRHDFPLTDDNEADEEAERVEDYYADLGVGD